MSNCLGGHTSEMKALLSTLDYERYQPRTYIYCHGDDLSLRSVSDIESKKGALTSSNVSTFKYQRSKSESKL